jgi:hypothetical protein
MSNGHQDSNESRLSLRDEAKRKFSPGRILKAAIASFAACAMTLPALAAALPPPVFVTGSATGTITVTFTVAPPALSTVSCSVSLISNDQRAPADSSTVTAPVSGSTATCVVTVNYRWRLTTPSTDTMTIAYSVQGPVQVSSGLINIIPMPADGTHLSQSFGVTQ